jgi:predicted membrane-bound spermidine synthase
MLEPYPSLFEGNVSFEEFYSLYDTKIYPVTDDNPFFLSFEKPIPKILEVLLYISIIIVGIFLVIPFIWLRSPSEKKSDLRISNVVIYFAALGSGFILIELALLQKLILLLGNPTTTFAILLFTMLLSSGIGSLISTKIIKREIRNITFIIAGIIIIGFLYVLIVPDIIYSVIAENFVTKIAVSIGLLFPIGFLMGIPLPTGMRVLKSHLSNHIPWMWAINGAFSVFGAVLSVVLGIMFGASYAMFLGIVIYLSALVIALRFKKHIIDIQKPD